MTLQIRMHVVWIKTNWRDAVSCPSCSGILRNTSEMKGAASEQEGKPATGHGRSEGREMKPCGGGGRPLATLELLGRNKSLYEKKIGYLYCFFFVLTIRFMIPGVYLFYFIIFWCLFRDGRLRVIYLCFRFCELLLRIFMIWSLIFLMYLLLFLENSRMTSSLAWIKSRTRCLGARGKGVGEGWWGPWSVTPEPGSHRCHVMPFNAPVMMPLARFRSRDA